MCFTGLVFFTRQYKEQHGIKNTPEGVVLVRMHCTGLLFSLPGRARNTYDIKNTPEGVVRMCCTSAVFFTWQYKEHTP